jgi:hypothetical protein
MTRLKAALYTSNAKFQNKLVLIIACPAYDCSTTVFRVIHGALKQPQITLGPFQAKKAATLHKDK